MRLKRCALSFLWKLVRDEISLMSDGSAFQARGPAMEKALSAAPLHQHQSQSDSYNCTEISDVLTDK